jgi:hypothetical protein
MNGSVEDPSSLPSSLLPASSSNRRNSLDGNVVYQGWVKMLDRRPSGYNASSPRPVVKKYLVLEMASQLLKYASTAAIVSFSSQIQGLFRLSKNMNCLASSRFDDGYWVDILDSVGSSTVRFSLGVDDEAEQLLWISSIQRVISACEAV